MILFDLENLQMPLTDLGEYRLRPERHVRCHVAAHRHGGGVERVFYLVFFANLRHDRRGVRPCPGLGSGVDPLGCGRAEAVGREVRFIRTLTPSAETSVHRLMPP